MTLTRLLGPDLPAQLRAAADALRAGDAEHTWELPAGEVRLPAGTVLGVPGRDLVVEAGRTTIVVDGASGAAPALRLVGRRVRLAGGTLRASGAGALVGLDVTADFSRLENVTLAGLRADTVTALRVRGGRTVLTGMEIADLTARTGHAFGLDVDVTGPAVLRAARLRRLLGDTVTGVRMQADGGELADMALSDLRPTATGDGALVTVSVAQAVKVSAVSVVRDLAGGAFPAAVDAAQDALTASRAGTVHTWLLPGGVLTLAAGKKLGDRQHGLRLRGRRAEAGIAATELRVGVGGPIAGDLVALDLAGTEVGVDELAVRAEATGMLTAVRIRADRADVADLALRRLRGTDVLGLDVLADDAGVTDLSADDLAGTGRASAALVAGGRVVLTRARVNRVSGADAASGLTAVAREALVAGTVRAARVSGDTAAGVLLRVREPAGELSALDVLAERVTAATGDAIGVAALSAGDVAARGVNASVVAGGRATGVLIAAGGEVGWSSGAVVDVRGATLGAAGARVLAAPGQRRVRVDGVRVEAVGGAQPGGQAQPARSWADLAADPQWLASDWPAVPLPGAGAPGHAEEVAGLAVAAPAGDALDAAGGAVELLECVLRRVSGTALQVDAVGRPVLLRGAEAWTAVRGGWVDGEDVLLAQLTWHRHRTGLELGPAAVRVVDVLVTDVELGLPVVGDDRGDTATASVTGRSQPPPQPGGVPPFRWEPLELAVAPVLGPDAGVDLLYRRPGPRTPLPASVVAGGVAPSADVDLRLVPSSPLHRLAVRVPGDPDGPTFLGAWPDIPAACTLRDPQPTVPTPPAAGPPAPGPLVDYLARDARSLLAVMLDRAQVVLPDWPQDSAADQTRMLLELLANRLDRLAYRQEVAVAEGYLGSARLRRSVEDHALLVDYRADPGLSATAMLRFDVTPASAAVLGLPATGTALTVPAQTVVVNRDTQVEAAVFTTEEALPVDLRLRSVRLAEPLHPGATQAELDGNLELRPGRWLLLAAVRDGSGAGPDDPPVDTARPSHVVQVIRAETAGGRTRVFWDFRRALPHAADPATTRVLGNIAPAHHGMPLTPVSDTGAGGFGALGELLRPWREQLTLLVDNTGGAVREVRLPHEPVSVSASGWPLPDAEATRRGRVQVDLVVDGEPWQQAESLAAAGPFDEWFAHCSAPDGGSALRFGDGTNGAALPRRVVQLDVAMGIGSGARGNVGAGVLTQVLSFGERGDLPEVLPGEPDREQKLLDNITVSNPMPALGGRDPEPLEAIRQRAPRAAREAVSAVVPADYEARLLAHREVAGARARFEDAALRDVVRTTLLLADEDALTAAGESGATERLRRWAGLRAELEQVRLLGTDVELVPPRFVPLDVDLVVDAHPWAAAEQVRADVQAALAGPGGLLDPDVSGLGGDVALDALYRRVQRVPGVAATRVRRLRRLVPGAPDQTAAGVLPVGADEVAVLTDPFGRPDHDGLLTVTVCGGVA